MMTSSGSGSYRVGGSLSSSNLSPLAPPFKVDKSFPKPNSTTHPPMNFPDVPVYGTCFDPAPGQFWNSSSSASSVPQCVAAESVASNTNSSSGALNMYGYQDCQSSAPPVYYGSTNNVSSYDPFTYEPFPNSISSNKEEAAKPFYPPFVSPPPQKDGYLGLGVGSGSGNDLLSGSSHLGGRTAAPFFNPKALSGDKGYRAKWGHLWSGLNDGEHEKWEDYAKGFVPKDLNMPNSSNKSSLFVDGSSKSQPFFDVNVHPFVDGSNNNHLFGDVSNKSNRKQGAYVTQDQGLHGKVPSVKDNCFDIFGGSYSLGNLGLDQQDCTSSSRCSRTRTSASASVSNECPNPQDLATESVTSFGGYQKAIGSSPADHSSQASFYMFGCASTAKTFPTTVTKLPIVDSSSKQSKVESASSAVKVNSLSIDTPNQSNTAVVYTSSYQMEPQMPVGSRCKSSIRIRRPVPSSRAASSCEKLETADNKLDDKGAYEKISTSPQPSHRFSLDGLNTEASDVEAAYSVEKHSVGSEGHNTAEDSPCWRGASSNRFSPFEQPESLTSDGILKKLDRCETLSSQDPENKMNTSDLKDISAGKLNKLNLIERSSVSDCSSKYNEDFGSSNPKYRCFDLNTGDCLEFSDDCQASTVGCNMLNKSKADLDRESSLAEQLVLEGDLSSARKISEAPSEKRRDDSPISIENLSSSPSNVDNLSNSLPGNEASTNPASKSSDSKIDVNVLLRTMMNLSEIFRSHCSNYRAEIEEKHSLAIKQIVSNLNAAMLMISGKTDSTTVLSSPDTFFQKEFPVAQMVNDAEALAALMKFDRTTEGLLDNVSFKDDRDAFGDVKVTEAVKKLLCENLQEEEIDQQKNLYKNLWLEAEASLCVMTAKARFMRMKNDMKRTHDEVKDKDKPKSFNFSADTLHRAVELATETKDPPSLSEFSKPTTSSQPNHIEEFNIPISQVASPIIPENERSLSKETCFPLLYDSRPGAHVNDCDDSFTTSHANDVEACVMDRYQILQNRRGYLESLNNESKQNSDEQACPSSVNESINSFHASGTTTKANDLETAVFGGYQILKSLDDSDYLNNKGKQLPGDENYLPDIDSSSPDKAFQDSQMSNSLGVTDEHAASVMARFRILQSRMNHSNSTINGSAPVQQVNTLVVEDGTREMCSSQQQHKIKITSFGPYPELDEDEDVNVFNIGIHEQPTVAPMVKTNRMSGVIFEGWYDNDCSSSEWEHVSRVDI